MPALAIALLAVASAFAVITGEMAVVNLEAARAQTAADAAALAAVVHLVDGDTAGASAAAAMLATRNGARVETLAVSGLTAEVVVRVGRVAATATATADGGWSPAE